MPSFSQTGVSYRIRLWCDSVVKSTEGRKRSPTVPHRIRRDSCPCFAELHSPREIPPSPGKRPGSGPFPRSPRRIGKIPPAGLEGKAACTPPGPLKETLIVGNSKLCAAETSDRFKTPFGQGFPGRQAEKGPRPPFQSQSFTGRAKFLPPLRHFPPQKPDGDGRKDETRCGCRGISSSKARR